MKKSNLQNIDRDPRIRRLFAAKPGYVFVEGDLSQAEARVVAYYSEEQRLIELYEQNKSVHEYVGSIIFQKPINKYTDPGLYHVAKVIVHGSNYGLGPFKMSEGILNDTGIVVTPSECKKRQQIYYQNFPNIVSVFQKGIERELGQNRQILTTPSGFSRKFYAPGIEERTRGACAHYAQNCVGYITYLALLAVDKSWLEPYYINQVHDSLLVEVPLDKLEEAKKSLKELMTQSIIIKGRTCTIPVDIKSGPTLGDLT